MQKRFKLGTLGLTAMLAVSLTGCSKVAELKANKLFKEANALYQSQNYKAAAAKYEETVTTNPDKVEAYFYLGNSYDNLYKATRRGEPENDKNLEVAIENYKKAAERDPNPKMKQLSLEYLVAAYGPDKLADPGQAEPILQRMIQLDPQNPNNYFVLARMYEEGGRYDEAEATLQKAKEMRPNDPVIYTTLAGYYNRQGEFEKTMEALQQRTEKEPTNPEAYYMQATFYWEKAFRDFRLKDAEKHDYVMKGLDAVNKSLEIKPDYMEAVVYKNILLRMQANLEKDPKKQQALIAEADRLRDMAAEMRKKKAAGVGD